MTRILLDMDGVLADFDGTLFEETSGFIEWPKEAMLRTRRFCTDYLSRDDARKVREHIEDTPFFSRLSVIPGARKGVKALEEMGMDLWVVSKPLESNATCASDKYEWIADHFPTLAKKVILAPNKSMVNGAILLDDAIKVQESVAASWTPVHYSYPHNVAKLGWRFTWENDPNDLVNMARTIERLTIKEYR